MDIFTVTALLTHMNLLWQMPQWQDMSHCRMEMNTIILDVPFNFFSHAEKIFSLLGGHFGHLSENIP